MPKLVLASKNKGKLRELQELLIGTGWEPVLLEEYPEAPPVEEDGDTFEKNAVKKALSAAEVTGEWALADDSGLEVDALNGAPGVHSARYAGVHGNDQANNDKLLVNLSSIPADQRGARFRSVVALASPKGRTWTAEGTCEGSIGLAPIGDGGFGYDPLFYLPNGQSMAQLPEAEKNRISHRGQAMARMRDILIHLSRAQGLEG